MDIQEVKLVFIAESLQQYFQDVTEAMRGEIIRTKSVETQTLLRSLSYRVYQQHAQGNGNLSFAEWGRFLDMGVRRGHPLGGIKATTQALEGKQKKAPVKPRKIYSPVVYGHLNGLIGRLAYGFTEETINRIKNQMQNTNG